MKLGQTVKDQITGFEGVITGAAEHITGFREKLIQPPMKDGNFVEPKWFDEDRLVVVKADPIVLKVASPGGDVAAPRK